MFWSHNVGAQTKVDLDFSSRQASEVNMPGYSSWQVGRVTSATAEFDGITVSISAEGAASAIADNWSKNIVQKSNKLVGDLIFVTNLDSDNNYKWITEGSTTLVVKISGLEAGTHTFISYHNDTDAGQTHPTMNVYVGENLVATGVETTSGQDKLSTSSKAVFEFSCEEGETVVIRYISKPEEGKTYTRTNVVMNAFEIDVNPYSIMDPKPASGDLHVDADDGSVQFSWTGASVATMHKLVYGTDSASVANATTYNYEGTATSYEATGFGPLQKYWWRVDEVDESGKVYVGEAIAFQPRRDAFPGAEGYGRYAVGGRGGVVYHVTNLLDNGDDENPIEGSLRYAIKKVQGPRTIVFDVAGVISLKSRLTCSDPYVTIAGQTAPGSGIMLRTCPFGMASDGITRFVRIRLGHKKLINDVIPKSSDSYGEEAGTSEETTLDGLDGMGMAGNDNSIMDHCSISWTIDEGFSSRNAKSLTLQRTLISEALNQAGHPNYGAGTRHGYAATIGGGEMSEGTVGSFHHNLLAHNEGRNWSMSGGLDGKGYYDGHHDMFNNVCYNWSGRTTDGGTHEGQFVNNYYKMGPASSITYLLTADLEGTGSGTQSYYVSGNIRESTSGTKTEDKLNDTYRYRLSGDQVLDWDVFQTERFFESLATIETAEAAYKNVLSDVGCNMPTLDLHDQRMVSETLNGTYTTKGSRSGKKGLIDSEEDDGCEGFDLEKLGMTEAVREEGWDTDQDGIPDWFEEMTGTDANAANNNDDRDDDNYTDLEEYLNWVAKPNYILSGDDARTIDLKQYFAGYKQPSLTTNDKNCQIDSEGNMTFKTSSRGLYVVSVTATEDGVQLTRDIHFAVTSNATAVKNISDKAQENDGTIYNILGQRMRGLQRGLNIQNGRKILKK